MDIVIFSQNQKHINNVCCQFTTNEKLSTKSNILKGTPAGICHPALFVLSGIRIDQTAVWTHTGQGNNFSNTVLASPERKSLHSLHRIKAQKTFSHLRYYGEMKNGVNT